MSWRASTGERGLLDQHENFTQKDEVNRGVPSLRMRFAIKDTMMGFSDLKCRLFRFLYLIILFLTTGVSPFLQRHKAVRLPETKG